MIELDREHIGAQFAGLAGHVWLNAAHQGPLPATAAAAVARAVVRKESPFCIDDDDFVAVAETLRDSIADLLNARSDEIVLGNSTSFGLHTVANGLSWDLGDEVLLVEGDYPATVLPWQRLAEQGVVLRSLRPRFDVLTAAEVASSITPRTRVLAVTWVNSFTGATCDLRTIGEECRRHGVLFVVNASQGVGARNLDVSQSPADAICSCGYKWLCGPYATGFAWIRPSLLGQLRPTKAYWLAMQSGRSLGHMRDTQLRDDLGARALDMFCPANFFNSAAWIESLRLWLTVGVGVIESWNDQLISRFLDGLDDERYEVLSPRSGPSRSAIVIMRGRRKPSERIVDELVERNIHVALREGNVRLSWHVFNTLNEVDRTLTVLHELG